MRVTLPSDTRLLSISQGNIYVAETITGRRIQKFVPINNDRH